MPDTSKPNPKPDQDELSLGSFAGAGIQFAAIVLFHFLGQWLDRQLDTTPVFLLAGVFIGGGAAFYLMLRRVSAAQKADDVRRKRQRETAGK